MEYPLNYNLIIIQDFIHHYHNILCSKTYARFEYKDLKHLVVLSYQDCIVNEHKFGLNITFIINLSRSLQ